MQIQKISSYNFTANRRPPASDRPLTVQEAYAIEDRIKTHNSLLINNQSALIGDAFLKIIELNLSLKGPDRAKIIPCHSEAVDAAYALKNAGKK